MEESERNKLIDDEHLRLLSLGYLIDGCITLAISCLLIFEFGVLYYFASHPEYFDNIPQQNAPMPVDIFRIFALVLGVLILLGILYGIAKIVSSRFIKQRKYRMFSYIVGIPGLLLIPYGTALGIATLVVLGRKSVRDQYLAAAP